MLARFRARTFEVELCKLNSLNDFLSLRYALLLLDRAICYAERRFPACTSITAQGCTSLPCSCAFIVTRSVLGLGLEI
jgi:hypothetical protein